MHFTVVPRQSTFATQPLNGHFSYPQFLWATLCITLFKSLQSRTTTGFPGRATKFIGYLAAKSKKCLFASENIILGFFF